MNERNIIGSKCTIFVSWEFNEGQPPMRQIIETLENTTTITDLILQFVAYKATAEDNRYVVEPLCRCLSNLRQNNPRHPLSRLVIASSGDMERDDGLADVFERFIGAAKFGGVLHLELCRVQSIPVPFLVENIICRGFKSLQLGDVSLSDGGNGAALSPWTLQKTDSGGPPDSSFSGVLALDKLTLGIVVFETPLAATHFANILARMNVTTLVLGNDYRLPEDIIVSEINIINIPTVQRLDLYRSCRIESLQTALEAGVASVTELTVSISCGRKDDTVARLQLLTTFIRGVINLNSLTMHLTGHAAQPNVPIQLWFQAIKACDTIRHFVVTDDEDQPFFSPAQVQQLHGIASRNEELYRFETSPRLFADGEWLRLMLQFKNDNCPTGWYRLARRLPEVWSF